MDYSKVGLKVGLEIHQQLATKHKLFCNCPVRKEDEFREKVKRRIRAVAGETGRIDRAALYEASKGKEFSYDYNNETACLLELDETPPGVMNEDALYTVLQACKLFSSTPVEEVHVMRKTVADGSAISGFQRTALVGIGGSVPSKNVGIQTICLEEDSAPTSETGYKLDRLGIPLIEIATEPEIHIPEDVKEVAKSIGTLLRSLNVKRGIGSIRQDINISISGGERVEIKGFQELDKIPEAVENEVTRQVCLLEIKDTLKKRNSKIVKDVKDVTRFFEKTESKIVKRALDKKNTVLVGVLNQFSGLLKKECADRTFGKELSFYARAYGYGIIHSDEDLSKYNLEKEFQILRKKLNVDENDVVFISFGKKPKKAVMAVLDRAEQCLKGVPEETRVADGIGSKYTRPLPGSERMYPETDVPVRSTDNIHIEIPETIEEKTQKLQKILPGDMATQMVRSEYFTLFDQLIKKFNTEPVTIATTLLSTIKELRRKGLDSSRITEDELHKLFAFIDTNQLAKSSIPTVLEKVASGSRLEEVVSELKPLSDEELNKIVSLVVNNNKDKNENVLMGLIMKEIKGKAEGSRVSKLLKEATNK
jgi:glutamyl-tRNA(Gln) amidotransferase subunit E